MKRKFLCTILSLALLISSIAWNSQSSAKANVKLSTKSVSITMGKTKKVSVKNAKKAVIRWKVSNKKTAKITKGSKKATVTMKGLKAGTTKLTCKVKFKGKKSMTLTAKIKVLKKSAEPTATLQPADITALPTTAPTATPTAVVPSEAPTVAPTTAPTEAPTPEPTQNPIIDGTVMTFFSQYAKDSDASKKVTDNGDKTSTVKFNAQYSNINLPLGDEDSYNMSQYTKLTLNVKCAEEFRVTLSNSKGVNIQPASSGTAEWSQWWYVGSGGTDGIIECDLSAFKKEDLADVAYVTLCANQETLKPLTIKGITFIGDTTIDKYIPATEDNSPQDPYTDSLRLTKSFSEINGSLMNNPLITQDYTADPTAIEYNGRLYVFATNDVVEFDSKKVPVNNAYNTHTIRIISSADLVNWRDEGNIDVTKLTSYATKSWAPTICSKTIAGKTKFFLYYTTGGNGIAVLTADSPAGPWSDPIGETLVNHDTPTCSEAEVPWCFDPSVLVDDDGTGYLYFGGGPDSTSGKETNQEHPKSARVVKLGADMTSLNGDPVEIDAKWYFEDNEINKIGDTYYYSYCTNWSVKNDATTSSCCIAYMTSKNPMTGWTYQGQLFANPGSVFGNYYNNHHRMTQFKDEWYLLYHTTLLEEAQYGTKKGYRSLHIDKLNWTDGVPSATATYESVTSVASLNPYNTINATEMAWNGGLATTNTDSGMVLSAIDTGDWFGINNVDFGTDGATSVQLSMAGTTTEGYIEVYLDAPSTEKGGTHIGNIDLVNTGSVDSYKNTSATLSSKATGSHKLFFVLRGTGYQIASWNFLH